ncbi:hypothetical protein [Amycolatopsis magusensis]|uniref:Uncharacterized protein n=1 Tax=Amycolatopsis magusensis TaxID=882444 RepID=A0ABS4PPS2_9PSEU|nr:hypothetical protein [Amycolatopsis magusensis]MBP2181424.1 hypothetical protein [Amycolatopsis magusensis]
MTVNSDIAVDSEGSNRHAETVLRCHFLGEIIDSSFIASNYDPPRSLTSSLKLSRAGNRIANQEKGGSVGLHEAQLAVFMTLWSGSDLLVSPEEIDVEQVRRHISSEVKRGKIRLPWIYGRELYDWVAESTFHGHMQPTYAECEQLLEELPQGVFQMGPYVTGPYGIVESVQWRDVPVPFSLPAFHCEEVDCHHVHGIRLNSGECGLLKALDQIRKKAAKKHERSVQFVNDTSLVLQAKLPPFSWSFTGSLPYFLVDTLTLNDLRKLLVELLDGTNGVLRAEVKRATEATVKSANEFAANLSSAQLLQVILLSDDSTIHSTLNVLINGQKIEIPKGETRRSKLHQKGSGPMSISIDASQLGVRYRPPTKLVQLRLRQILSEVYPEEDQNALRSMQWKLRKYEGDTSEKKLAAALATEEPVNLIKSLVVPDESACENVLGHLGLPSSLVSNLDDDQISSMLAWHIGFTAFEKDAALQTFNENADELKRIALSLPVALDRQDIKSVRGSAANLFASLEEVLKVTLCFSGWALINDHYASGAEFKYSKGAAAHFMNSWLVERKTQTESRSIEKMRLSDLLECISVVSRFLESAIRSPAGYGRSADQWSRMSREVESPFKFPFKHKLPFLDLSERSRQLLLEVLKSVSSDLNSGGALTVRNGLLHHNEEVPARDEIVAALSVVVNGISSLVSVGLYPVIFTIYSRDSDMNGRRRINLRSDDGQEVTLKRPSSIQLSGFPTVETPQVVLTRAGLADSGEPLRFEVEFDTAYRDMWTNFPRRPVRRPQHGLPAQLGALDSRT